MNEKSFTVELLIWYSLTLPAFLALSYWTRREVKTQPQTRTDYSSFTREIGESIFCPEPIHCGQDETRNSPIPIFLSVIVNRKERQRSDFPLYFPSPSSFTSTTRFHGFAPLRVFVAWLLALTSTPRAHNSIAFSSGSYLFLQRQGGKRKWMKGCSSVWAHSPNLFYLLVSFPSFTVNSGNQPSSSLVASLISRNYSCALVASLLIPIYLIH